MGKPTDKLCAMLDELGVEYEVIHGYNEYLWETPNGALVRASNIGTKGLVQMIVTGITPEQAIAATLGDEAGWRSVALGLFDSLEKADLEAAQKWITDNNLLRDELAFGDAIAATLGSEITGDTSDGYHTFNELYHHRAVLFSVIVRDHRELAWKARKHHDGTMYDGMFIVGVVTPDGQATYHYDIDPYWDMFDCDEMEFAPEWDGHTPDDAIARIATLGSGKLTAEQVMTTAGKHQPDYCSDTHVCFDWQAIAATLGGGECENLAGYPLVNFECSVCGCKVYGGDELGANIEDGRWNFCPNCRRKVKR